MEWGLRSFSLLIFKIHEMHIKRHWQYLRKHLPMSQYNICKNWKIFQKYKKYNINIGDSYASLTQFYMILSFYPFLLRIFIRDKNILDILKLLPASLMSPISFPETTALWWYCHISLHVLVLCSKWIKTWIIYLSFFWVHIKLFM